MKSPLKRNDSIHGTETHLRIRWNRVINICALNVIFLYGISIQGVQIFIRKTHTIVNDIKTNKRVIGHCLTNHVY